MVSNRSDKNEQLCSGGGKWWRNVYRFRKRWRGGAERKGGGQRGMVGMFSERVWRCSLCKVRL